VSRREPAPDCFDLGFEAGYPIGEAGEVALEDYARALTGARAAEAVREDADPSRIEGVHVCGLGLPVTQHVLVDLEDFARSLVAGGPGLGWS
jgi:hypothetical protein